MASRRGGDEEGLGIAVAALSYFATQPEVLDRFFALTGLDPHSLREVAGTPGFVTGVLDFVLSDEELLTAIAAEQDVPPAAIAAARQRMDHAPVEEDWPPRPMDPADDWA